MRRTIFRLAPTGRLNTEVQSQFSPVDYSKLVAWDNPGAEVEPGKHVIAVCKQYNIAFPNQLRPLKGLVRRNQYKLTVTTSRQHCFFHQSMKYFDKFEHPFAKSLLDIYIEKKKEPLWMSSNVYGASAFPNKTASRRINHALRDALIAAGYDRFGRRVYVDGESSVIADLYGTLRVLSTAPLAICNAKFADLVECAKQIISGVEIHLRRDKNGRHIQSQQQDPTIIRPPGQGQRRQRNDQRGRR
ncbi:hypothetical protein F5Y09DRAFT_333778 [Xylaria sp. FL1042]|nr:hypothetical protein F5Y09DRAFT_333778 [Xylaria sp. FL1042]